jgi:hypothetical protein
MNDPEIRTRLHAHFDKQGAPWVDEITLGKRRVDMVALVDGVQEVRQGKNARRTGALVGEFRAPNSSTAAQGLRCNVVENRSPPSSASLSSGRHAQLEASGAADTPRCVI